VEDNFGADETIIEKIEIFGQTLSEMNVFF